MCTHQGHMGATTYYSNMSGSGLPPLLTLSVPHTPHILTYTRSCPLLHCHNPYTHIHMYMCTCAPEFISLTWSHVHRSSFPRTCANALRRW